MKTVPVIVGPTASGKTALSLLMAQELNGQIISADSRQFYKYMDIGTAKVSRSERAAIPHHFIDILEPDAYYSAGMFAADAREKIADLQQRNILPIVAGGSGLYIKALTDGIFEFDASFESERKRLLQRVENEGLQTLYEALKKCDPVYAEKISSNDKQRITRALEVFQATGRTFSDWHDEQTEKAEFTPFYIGIKMEREILYQRINDRVERMLEQGLVDEVKRLQAMGFNRNLNALNTVGYKEVFAYINQEISYPEMTELIKRNTRRYAKRQLTWFKTNPDIHWQVFKTAQEMRDLAQAVCLKLSEKGEL